MTSRGNEESRPGVPASFPPRAGIALGSNLGDRLANLRAAREAIRALPAALASEPCLSAPLFETEAVGCEPGAAPFLNSVIEIGCPALPPALLAALLEIEIRLGRPAAHERNRDRVIDLDLLYCGGWTWERELLFLPHLRLHQRRFVLAPLAALRPDLLLPNAARTVAELLAALDDPAKVELIAVEW